MDLNHPLRSLVPSMDGVALGVLAGTEGALGVSRIHSLGGHGSRPGIAKVLDRLVEHGLVIAEPTNKGFQYRLNREHLLAPAVIAAAQARTELLRRLGEACTDARLGTIGATLFGSVARRAAGPSSDVDVLLVVRDDVDTSSGDWVAARAHLEHQVYAWTGNRLGLIAVTVTHLQHLVHSREPIVESWRADAVTLSGVDVSTLMDRGQRVDP